jgi:hypothetical protein
MSKIVRMITSPISANPRIRTDSSTSKKHRTLMSAAAANAKTGHGMFQPNHSWKFVLAKYAKPPNSETSNSE